MNKVIILSLIMCAGVLFAEDVKGVYGNIIHENVQDLKTSVNVLVEGGTLPNGLTVKQEFKVEALDGTNVIDTVIDKNGVKAVALKVDGMAGTNVVETVINGDGIKLAGALIVLEFPTSTNGLVNGQLWNDSGTIKVYTVEE